MVERGVSKTEARGRIAGLLRQVKQLLAQPTPLKLSEADTRANFIDPLLVALGWSGLERVRREYHVQTAGQFIDYVCYHNGKPLLAVEAKALPNSLTEKDAAQLVVYCAIEGIEWAALTNARELQLFNAFLKPDLSAKRLLRLDLLAFNGDEEFDALFEQVWLLSHDSMTTPTGARTWLHQRRMDRELRNLLLDPTSTAVHAIRKALAKAEVRVSSQDIAQWFRTHLTSPITVVPTPVQPVVQLATAPRRSSPSNAPASQPDETEAAERTPAGHDVRLADLVQEGLIKPGSSITLTARGQDFTQATVDEQGRIVWQGKVYRALSDRDFSRLVGWNSVNGWKVWCLETPNGRVPLAELRNQLLSRQEAQAG